MKKHILQFTILLLALSIRSFAQDPVPYQYRSVKTEHVKIKGVKDETGYSALNATDKISQIAYYDGLGRPLAGISVQATPVRHDLIQLFGYDALGRTDTVFLPFAAGTSNGAFITRGFHVKEQKGFYADGADRVEDDPNPYAVSVYDNSPLAYVKEQGAPGTDWQPGNRSVKRTFRANVSNEFRVWRHDLTSPQFYGPNELAVEEVTDENNGKLIIVKDKTGRLIERHVQAAVSTWLKTLYVYDEKGRVKLILQPEGVKQLGAGTTISTELQEHQSFRFFYDDRNRLIEKKVPGVAPVYYAYDPLDRLVLTQDGHLRTQNKWTYIKYDRNNRPVMQGTYTNNTYTTRSGIQQNVLDVLNYTAGESYYERKQSGTSYGYSNNSFPVSDTEVLSVAYYGDYDLNADGTDDYLYAPQGLVNEGTAVKRPVGRVTAVKAKVLGTSDWIVRYLFYDRYGNVIQVRSNNHMQLLNVDNLTTSVYDFNGRITLSKNYHNTGGSNITVVNRYNYDHMGRLLQIFQKNNNDAEVQVASYRYNDLGQLVSKNLHCATCTDDVVNPNGVIHAYNILVNTQQPATPVELVAHNSIRLANGFRNTRGVRFKGRISSPAEHEAVEASNSLQSIDYRYNIRGWLTTINNAQLTSDGERNDDNNDLFGMELLYNNQENGLNDLAGDARYWNGNISAIKWKGPGKPAGVAGQRGYRYKYDMANRLEHARFQAVDITAWSTELNAFNEALTYDHNGNIKTLQRNQRKHNWIVTEAAYGAEQVDDLSYAYSNSNKGNLLTNVHDVAVNQGGFTNGSTSTSATEYAYDDNGSLIRDDNKLISGITYNVLGKAQQVSFTNGRTIQYTYDAAGTKLKMVVNPGNVVTDYVNGFVYEGGNLKFFGSPEGRVVKTATGAYEYQYAIGDHQGNTRVVFTSATPAPFAPVATFEGDVNDNVSQYQNVVAANVVTFNNANHTTNGGKVVRLNQTYKTGPSKSIKVFPGDAVDMEVWAYYEGSSGWGSTNTGAAAWITAVAAGFGGSPAGSLESQAIYNGVNSAIGTFGMAGNRGNTRPSAYLNFILFDKDYKLLDMGWTAVPESANMSRQKLSIPNVKITEPGYIFVYLSYEAESNNWVYFDDLKVTHTQTSVLQYNEYYPFGLQTSTSWTREGHKNDFLYNSGSELNTATQWYETMFRGYDAALGRFLQVDAHAASYAGWSPYSYAFNNPVFWNDPLGLDPENPGFSDEVWEMVMDAWDATPDGGIGIFDFEGGALVGFDISGDGWNITGGTLENDGGACSYCPGETANYGLYARVENQYGTWINNGKNRWIDVSTQEQRQNRRGPQQETDWFGKLGGLLEKNYDGGVVYDGDAWYGTNFIGPGKDENPYTLSDPKSEGQYLKPKDMVDAAAQRHDYSYFIAKTGGLQGALFDKNVKIADLILANDAAKAFHGYFRGEIDPITGNQISPRTRDTALDIMITFWIIGGTKPKF